MRFFILLLLLAPSRTWTDSTGKFTVQADLVDAHDGIVYLESAGKTKKVPLVRLSDADQAYVRSRFPMVEAANRAVDKEPLPTTDENHVQPQQKTTKALPSSGIPKYTILNKELQDTPIKTEVVVNALITGEITENNVKALINELRQEAQKVTNFKYHGGHPTHIFVFVYPTVEHYKEGLGQYVGMFSQMGKDDKPDVTIDKEFIASLSKPPVEKFGLSEGKRKEIFHLIALAEQKAEKEAEARFPSQPAEKLKEGQTVRLKKETPLMPEMDPVNPLESISRIRHLPAGTSIKVTRVANKKETPWYAVNVLPATGAATTSGWINRVALIGQLSPQFDKQAELADQLSKLEKKQLSKRYGLTDKQLSEIASEAMEKNWPSPP